MADEHFVLDKGKRVFVVRGNDSILPIEGGGSVSFEKTFISDTGKSSKYPTILMGVGDKVFVPGGKIGPKDKVYSSARNRKNFDATFNYVAYNQKFEGEYGYMIRCVERK